MADFDDLFQHIKDLRVLICRNCRFAPVPDQVQSHLKIHHARLSLKERQSIVAQVNSMSTLARHPTDVVYPKPSEAPLEQLPIFYDGIRCTALTPQGEPCARVYRDIHAIKKHCKDQHNWVNGQRRGGNARGKQKHTPNRLWETDRACQRLFEYGQWKRFFEVAAPRSTAERVQDGRGTKAFFERQIANAQKAKEEAQEEANIVAGFDGHRSTVVPWLQTTGIVHHVQGLKKDEIWNAITLATSDEEPALAHLLTAMDALLTQAHSYCFDGPECMLTWQCRVVLSRFQSAQVETIGRTRAFEPRKNEGTLRKYFGVAKQLMAYVYRVVAKREHYFTVQSEDVTRPEDAVILNTEQRRAWRAICRLLSQESEEEAATSTSPIGDELQAPLLGLWMALICDTTGAQRYRSPVISFCSMLSIKQSTAAWIEPGNFNSHLSAMIWIVQLLVFYNSARKEQSGNGTTLAHVKRCCEDYLQQTVETPIGELLRWRLLLFQVSQSTVSERQATWNGTEDVVSFEGANLHVSDVPRLLECEYDKCRRLLYEDLMLNSADCPAIHAYNLKDSPEVGTPGWDFTQHRDNQAILQGREQKLLRAIERSATLQRLFLVDDEHAELGKAWREGALTAYEQTVQEFLQRLCTLVHISGGQPVREPEFFSMTWYNTQRSRRITVRHDRLMIHLQYHKGQQQTGQHRDNIRFLAHPISDLLLDYLVYVQPLRQIFLRQSSPRATLSPYLFESDNKVWPESRLSRCLTQSSVRAGIDRLHISNWRQMTVAIVKTKFAGHLGVFEENDEDEDAEEAETDIRAMTKQRNHKTRTVNRAYANQAGSAFGNVWDGLLRKNLRASTIWQDFWGVDRILGRRRKRKAHKCEEPALQELIAGGIYRPRRPWSAEALLIGLKKLYGDESVTWRSVEQERTLVAISSNVEQVIAILPTGAGKSAAFMLPCTMPDAAVTVLIVPLVALYGNLTQRLDQLRVEYIEWTLGERREAGLVLVSAEAACQVDFRRYIDGLSARQRLDRIVFDECHLTVTSAHYRSSLVDITSLRAIRTQFVYLTATLPPTMQREFEQRNFLYRPTVIRAPSHRPNIMYIVSQVESSEGSLLQHAAREARDAWLQEDFIDHARDKIILYVRSISDASTLAALLDCESYTGHSGTAEEKRAILDRWTRDPLRPYIVATSALAEGFDHPHVRLVINVDEPHSLFLFSQESGRAGRDRERAYSLVILPFRWQPSNFDPSLSDDSVSAKHDPSLANRREQMWVHEYLSRKQCLRTSLSERLDEPSQRRWCMTGDVACTVCRRPHEEVIPPKDLSAAPILSLGLTRMHQESLQSQSELAQYCRHLASVQGSCLFCRSTGEPFNHAFDACPQRQQVFEAQRSTIGRHKKARRGWIADYTACFYCFQPQTLCLRADPSSSEKECQFRDAVMPLCIGIYKSVYGPTWLFDNFGRTFTSRDEYMDWLGEESRFGGSRAI